MTRLAQLTWPEVADRSGTLLVVPLGSTEQHGPHLPLSTDTDIAQWLADALAEQLPAAVVAPAIPYGSSGEHAAFPGTLSLGTAVLEQVLVELVRSADLACSRVLLLNAHGGNSEALSSATAVLQAEGRDVRAWWPRWPGDAHAGRTETSIQLARGARVGADRPVGDPRPLAELLPQLRTDGVRAVTPSGVLGDATGSTADEGRELLDAALTDLLAFVATW